jgi:hypothetical protein
MNSNAALLEKYDDLVDGIRLIRRAVDRASRVGILPHGRIGVTPREECEAIARAIYAAAEKRQGSAFPWGVSSKEAVH